MRLSVVESLEQVPAEDWNRVVGNDNPFLRHEFLYALENTGCTTPASGWSARHLLLHADTGAGLAGLVPMYLKSHSYGEYVFDWAWADAYDRAGLHYYPKLVVTVPFSPVTGDRILVAPDQDRQSTRNILIGAARGLADDLGVSSLHWLFTTPDDTEALETHGMMRRTGYQFHWQNRGYGSFDDFLAGFSADKRKKIRRERLYVREAGVTMTVLTGADITAVHWDQFYDFYHLTIRKHGAIPYLTRSFFQTLGRTLADRVVMIVGHRHGECVAAALNLRGADTLYGRYWGGQEGINSLHFETCYYRAIEYCIEAGIQRFEAGAQGEHKLARGFLPSRTHSAHWLRRAEFGQAIANFLERERNGLEFYLTELNEHSPFKNRHES